MSGKFSSWMPVSHFDGIFTYSSTLMVCLICIFFSCSDPPLSEEDIPSGLWLCHMCQMLQKQRPTNASKVVSNDSNFTQNEIQQFRDSRPSTPLNSDGVINAAKIRLCHKRSSSRVSSSSDNSSSCDREIKAKISRSNSEQCSNGAEMIDSCENTATIVDSKECDEQQSELKEEVPVQIDSSAHLVDTTDVEQPREDISEQSVFEIIANNSPEVAEATEVEPTIESQEECTPKGEENIDLTESNVDTEIETEEKSTETESDKGIEEEIETKMETNSETESIINGEKMDVESSDENQVENGNEDEVNFKSPLDDLIRAATILNPRQFELPRELAIFPQFPGDEKRKLNFFFVQFIDFF